MWGILCAQTADWGTQADGLSHYLCLSVNATDPQSHNETYLGSAVDASDNSGSSAGRAVDGFLSHGGPLSTCLLVTDTVSQFRHASPHFFYIFLHGGGGSSHSLQCGILK